MWCESDAASAQLHTAYDTGSDDAVLLIGEGVIVKVCSAAPDEVRALTFSHSRVRTIAVGQAALRAHDVF